MNARSRISYGLTLRMQNSEFKMQKAESRKPFVSAFCILHFALPVFQQ
jgi:hypothetical protein